MATSTDNPKGGGASKRGGGNGKGNGRVRASEKKQAITPRPPGVGMIKPEDFRLSPGFLKQLYKK
jgi:hypothetical protein